MKTQRAIKLAYAAGFMDGEGCVSIHTSNPRKGRSKRYILLVTITQKDGKVMDWLYGNFGGCVVKKNKGKNTFSPDTWIYEWRADNKTAYEFCKQVYQFSIVKKRQLELAVRFGQRIVQSKRFVRLSDNELKIREQMFNQMKSLKRDWQLSKNPNVVEYMVQP